MMLGSVVAAKEADMHKDVPLTQTLRYVTTNLGVAEGALPEKLREKIRGAESAWQQTPGASSASSSRAGEKVAIEKVDGEFPRKRVKRAARVTT